MFKLLIYGGIIIGGLIGGYVPVLFGSNPFSLLCILLSALCSLVGLWIGFKIYKIYFG
jgi:hypothetical protein